MEEKADTIEIKASTPKFSRLGASALFDALTVILLSFLLSLAVFPIYFATPAYQEMTSLREEVMVGSRLYEKHDGGVRLISTALKEDDALTYGAKNESLSSSLSYCYTVYLNEELEGKGLERLNGYYASCAYEGTSLFSSDGSRLLEDERYDEAYFNAYSEVAESHGANDLSLKKGFSEARTKILWGYLVSFLIAFSLSCIALLLVVPLCLKKGKRTLGMQLTKLAYLDQWGFSPSWQRWALHFLFQWILILCGAFFSFGVTIVFSCAFSAWRKDHQGISDYVLALYPVDASSSEIHEKEEELLKGDGGPI